MRLRTRSWKLALPVALVAVAAVATSVAMAGPSQAKTVRLAIMTDCKGAFGFGYELDIGGAQAALIQFAGAKAKNKNKPSAGVTGGRAGGANIRIVGYGCGDDTSATAAKETRRLMEQLRADVMVGPLSGDEAVTIANYAKTHESQTFIIGTAGSQDPTLQIAPKNMFRYHGDGAQWNAGIGEIAYKKLKWRRAAIIMDDYSFGWTSAAGMIADFCAVGGQITKRVFPPLNTTDYSSYIRQLPRPGTVDGYFWVVGGTGTSASLKAFEQAYGSLKPTQHIGNLFFGFLGADKVVAPKVVGSYIGGFGNAPGVNTPKMRAYRAFVKRTYPKMPADDGFFYNYYMAAKALVQGLNKSKGAVGAALQAALPRSIDAPFQISNGGRVRLDSRRQAIQDQYQLQLVRKGGAVGPQVVAFVPNVDQSFGGLFTPASPPPGRTQPPCKKQTTPWQGKMKVVANGVITNRLIK